jgi:hypothetical protein
MPKVSGQAKAHGDGADTDAEVAHLDLIEHRPVRLQAHRVGELQRDA